MVKMIVLKMSARAATDKMVMRVAVTNDALIFMDTILRTSLNGPLGSLRPIVLRTDKRRKLSSSIVMLFK